MTNILIVDDSKYIRTVVKEKISQMLKANVFMAKSLEEANRFIRRNKFDIAILDVHLPDANNGEVIDLALEYDIPVIVLSSGINETIKNIVLKKDIVEYVAKSDPQSIAYIVKIVSRILKNREENILIVDDSKTQREEIKVYLEKLQLNIEEANDATEAIEIIKSKNISLVLIDYRLQGMNGMELTMLLRQTYTKDRLAIIGISGISSNEVATNFLRYGANDFIAKPFTYQEFSARINANLDLLDLFEENNRKTKEIEEAYKLFNNGNIIVFKWQRREDWPVEYVSESLRNILGYKPENFLNSTIKYAQLIHEDDLARVFKEVQDNSQQKVDSFTHQDYRLRHRNGSYVWVTDSTQILYDSSHKITNYVGYVTDITNQRERDKKLYNYIERFNLAIESSRDGLWDWNIKENTLFCSPTLLTMLGCMDGEIPQCSYSYLKAMIHPDDAMESQRQLDAHLKGNSDYFEIEYRVKTKSGKYKWILNRAKVVFDNNNEPERMIGFYTDVENRKEMELKLERMSATDSLTGLLNRHGFFERFKIFQKGALRFGRKIAILFIDLDGFKAVNDNLGHAAGDDILIYVANTLKATVRDNELCIRLGGDEFIIFIPEYNDKNELISLAQRLLSGFKEPLNLVQGKADVSLSIGIATAQEEVSIDKLIFQADSAMYKVKNRGKNGYEFAD